MILTPRTDARRGMFGLKRRVQPRPSHDGPGRFKGTLLPVPEVLSPRPAEAEAGRPEVGDVDCCELNVQQRT